MSKRMEAVAQEIKSLLPNVTYVCCSVDLVHGNGRANYYAHTGPSLDLLISGCKSINELLKSARKLSTKNNILFRKFEL